MAIADFFFSQQLEEYFPLDFNFSLKKNMFLSFGHINHCEAEITLPVFADSFGYTYLVSIDSIVILGCIYFPHRYSNSISDNSDGKGGCYHLGKQADIWRFRRQKSSI